MEIKSNNTKHCRSRRKNLPEDSYHKHVESEQYTNYRRKENCETCKILYFTSDYENHLNSEADINTVQEQQSKIKLKCNLCDKSVVSKFWENHENSVRLYQKPKHTFC